MAKIIANTSEDLSSLDLAALHSPNRHGVSSSSTEPTRKHMDPENACSVYSTSCLRSYVSSLSGRPHYAEIWNGMV